jgi:UrcA family protein
MQRSIICTLAALAFSLSAMAPAAAAEFQRAPQRVALADLDLNDQHGAEAALGRIEFAARNQCGDREGPMTLAERSAIRRCMSAKIERGIEQVGNANVSAAYFGRRGIVAVDGR